MAVSLDEGVFGPMLDILSIHPEDLYSPHFPGLFPALAKLLVLIQFGNPSNQHMKRRVVSQGYGSWCMQPYAGRNYPERAPQVYL